ncbi:MAG: hypothetical protein MJZ90_07650 [Bacteroidales bacterium]|nr:hypothetical protein [Bacteroidales bacterium]
MSKSNIITLAALAIAAYFLFFRKDRKENDNTTETKTELGANPETDAVDWPELPIPEPLIETTETKEPCPYCGTPNAVVKRTYRNGQLTQQSVSCGNKSCPGPRSKQNKNSQSSYSGKIQGAGAQ